MADADISVRDALGTLSQVGLKVCTGCKVARHPADFYANRLTKDGLYSRCKPCHNATTKRYSQKHKARDADRARAWRHANPEKAKEVSRQSAAKSYRADAEKHRARSKAFRDKNPAMASAISKASRAKNPEGHAAWWSGYYEKNKERIKAAVKRRCAELGESLKPYNAERAMRRQAKKLLATPEWGDRAKIQSFYVEAARLTAKTGVLHHVDHIVPLQSRRVSGLHVEFNLQVLPWAENLSKSNRWWPDMP